MVDRLQWLASRAFEPAKQSSPSLLSTVLRGNDGYAGTYREMTGLKVMVHTSLEPAIANLNNSQNSIFQREREIHIKRLNFQNLSRLFSGLKISVHYFVFFL